MDLSGPWRAALADDDLRRGALGLDYDDNGWEPVPVPGHWRSTPAFAESDGPLLYRTRFELDAGPGGARHWVVLDGVFYQADVFLDGAYLGDSEGYFFPHSFEITDLARLVPEHVLAVEVACVQPQYRRPSEHDRRLPALGLHGPRVEPGRPVARVRIERTGPVRIPHALLCRDAEPERGDVMVRPSSTATRPAPSDPHTVYAPSSASWRVTGRRDKHRRVDLRRRRPAPAVARALGDQPASTRGRGRPSTTSRATPVCPHRAATGGDAPLGPQRQR